MTVQLLGIDVSGSAEKWKVGCRNPSVWIATAHVGGERLVVDDLRPVQALEGAGEPFERLLALLSAASGFAAIDAPFSLPRDQAASAPMLWAQAAHFARAGRPFGRAAEFLAQTLTEPGRFGIKAYRACDEVWRRRGVDAPSALWSGPRGAAAAAVAVMTLLHRRGGPVWPVRAGGDGAVLVEAFPAAQLATWSLDFRYHGRRPKAAAARAHLLAALIIDHGLKISDRLAELCLGSPDALDAVICLYAAKTLADGRHPRKLPATARSEGWIVVDETAPPARAAPLLSPVSEHHVYRHFDALQAALSGETGGDDPT
ncbi:MAG TPA: DUF429 domain-containing protein [Caulobacteraceae bacterium]|nr:DUF429 domain-containing protein [Caulobacteraceae bacterium]